MPEARAGCKHQAMLRNVSFEVLVVLGCRVDGAELSHAALRRVERAARAYADDGADLVIASGGKFWHGHRECETFARGLVAHGVPPERILQERESLTTRGNARGVERLLCGRNITRLGVVTCDWHMPRALRLFRRLGLEPSPLPATSPPRPWHVKLVRQVREHGSLLLDLLLAPVGLRT